MKYKIDPDSIKGFIEHEEGEALYQYALEYSRTGDCLEVGSYCGKSAVYIGTAVKKNSRLLYSIDHHRGSEEQQPDQEYYDPDLINDYGDGINTLPFFIETLEKSELNETVIPIISSSEEAFKNLDGPFSMIFIDGGHSKEAAETDYRLWSSKLVNGGLLAIHDVFPNPDDGGRPPFEIYCLALESNNFEKIDLIGSLALLRKIN
tara:strand:- start:113 stop:727 length:615 start_codon:yes stop_codon:yes gene_type:complete